MSERPVKALVQTQRTFEGEGFAVRRPFPTRALPMIDPFLLLDHMGPSDYGPGEAKGAPDHPHRGFETVTYLLEGTWEHEDSAGNSGNLGPGDVQWMTAGSGVVHSELPAKEVRKNGGRVHGLQLWVNLPAKDKMMKPRYQDMPDAKIPVAKSPDGKVRVKVVAGEALGAKAVIDTRTPILYLHFTMEPGAEVVQPVPSDFNAFAYVIEGKGAFGPDARPAEEGQMVLFDAGDSVRIAAKSTLSVLLVGGRPLNEPVARYGPFVMNTREEIEQAFQDYKSGRLGAIARAK